MASEITSFKHFLAAYGLISANRTQGHGKSDYLQPTQEGIDVYFAAEMAKRKMDERKRVAVNRKNFLEAHTNPEFLRRVARKALIIVSAETRTALLHCLTEHGKELVEGLDASLKTKAVEIALLDRFRDVMHVYDRENRASKNGKRARS